MKELNVKYRTSKLWEDMVAIFKYMKRYNAEEEDELIPIAPLRRIRTKC